MALPTEADAFLEGLRRGLVAMPKEERDDVVEEIRSHLLERQAQGKENLLEGFDSAEALAADFVAERSLRGALSLGTPWAFARALAISARDSFATLLLLVGLVLGQVVAFFCLLTAVMKLFSPADFGLWAGNGSFYIGRRTESVQELLGLWGFPLLLALGVLLFWGSNRGLRALARWRLRSYRRS